MLRSFGQQIMNQIDKAVQKHYPEHSITLDGPVHILNIPQFLNKVFVELGYTTISVNDEQAHQIFEILDENGDKVVSKDEIKRGLKQILYTHGVEKHEQTWSNITQHPSSKLHKPQPKLEEQQLLYLFQKYDKNKTGQLQKGEIVGFMNQYLKLVGKTTQFNETQSELLISWIDQDYNNKISQKQIWRMYTEHLQASK